MQGEASPCCFHHPALDISLLVHGDDFVAVARSKGRQHLSQALRSHYEVKEKTLGPGVGEEEELRILGRTLAWTPEGLTLEADAGHHEMIIDQLGMETANPVTTPGEAEESGIPYGRAYHQEKRG